jgi:hypothetical protein
LFHQKKKKTTKKVTKNDNDQLKSESVRTLLNLLLQHMLPNADAVRVLVLLTLTTPKRTGPTAATMSSSAMIQGDDTAVARLPGEDSCSTQQRMSWESSDSRTIG